MILHSGLASTGISKPILEGNYAGATREGQGRLAGAAYRRGPGSRFAGLASTSKSIPKLEGIIGGATRDRTADLLHAMQALSQLSYSPTVGTEG